MIKSIKSAEQDSLNSEGINQTVDNVSVVVNEVSNWTLDSLRAWSVNDLVAWSKAVSVTWNWHDLWVSWNYWIVSGVTSSEWHVFYFGQVDASSNWADFVVHVVVRKWSFSKSDGWGSVSGFLSWLSNVKLVQDQFPVPLGSGQLFLGSVVLFSDDSDLPQGIIKGLLGIAKVKIGFLQSVIGIISGLSDHFKSIFGSFNGLISLGLSGFSIFKLSLGSFQSIISSLVFLLSSRSLGLGASQS